MITCPRNWANLLSVAIVMILTIAFGCQKEESPPTTNSTTTSTEEISAEDTSTESSSSKADAANLDEKSGETSSAIPASSQGIHHILSLLPDFELTDQQGNPYSHRQLYSKVWVANFIFTRCAATCPAQTEKMREFQDLLQSHPSKDQIRLVSFTVDPQHDTPEVMKEYADEIGADHEQWKFLTGRQETLWQLSKEGFKLAVGHDTDDTQMPIFHSPMFVLIDPYLRVRGFYDVMSDEGLERLSQDLTSLLEERMPQPPGIFTSDWLETRRQAQLKTVDKFEVNYDFSFSNQLEESGIRFINRAVDDGTRDYKAAHYDHGNGVAIADVNGDGLYDIYFCTLVGRNELWQNMGDGKFQDITEQAGVAVEQPISVSASFADTDNDGDPDLYVTTVRGGNHLFENDGNGFFQDITANAGLEHQGHSSGAVFFDFDRDGLLDLFLTNVGKYTTDERAPVTREQVRRDGETQYDYFVAYPDAFGGHLKPEERNERSLLYRNLGGNRFQDVSDEMQLHDVSWSGDAAPVDFNQDGWIDLYVLNMQGHDQYYVNVEGKRFEKKSRDVFPKTPWGSMSVKAFDYDNDDDFDLFVTDMHSDMSQEVTPNLEKQKAKMAWPQSFTKEDGNDIWGNAFYRNLGDGTFEEVSDQLGAENYWPWGFSVGDLNADGFDDVFIASSMNYPFRYGINTVLLNNRGKGFLDSEFILGVEPRQQRVAPWYELEVRGKDRDHPSSKQIIAYNPPDRIVVWSALGSRSCVMFDLDEDGDLDIITNDFNSPPLVLVSNLSERNSQLSFLKIKLVGNRSNRDGLGALVKVYVGEQSYLKAYDGQSGYLTHSLYPLYFGLDGADTIDRIEVTWPSGSRQLVAGPLAANTTIEIVEESSQP